jgi:hypothetical protein
MKVWSTGILCPVLIGRYLPTKLHGATFQMTAVLTLTLLTEILLHLEIINRKTNNSRNCNNHHVH